MRHSVLQRLLTVREAEGKFVGKSGITWGLRVGNWAANSCGVWVQAFAWAAGLD